MKIIEEPSQWMDYLPLITLSLCSSNHLDSKVNSTQATFALDPLFPGQLFESPLSDFDVRNDIHLHNMTLYLEFIRPIHPRPQFKDYHINPHLINCTRVYLWKATKSSAIDNKYIGPLKVLYKGETHWNVKQKGRRIKVSINRLKAVYDLPAHHLLDDPESTDSDRESQSEEDETYNSQYSTCNTQLQNFSSDHESLAFSEDNIMDRDDISPYAHYPNFPEDSCLFSDDTTCRSTFEVFVFFILSRGVKFRPIFLFLLFYLFIVLFIFWNNSISISYFASNILHDASVYVTLTYAYRIYLLYAISIDII